MEEEVKEYLNGMSNLLSGQLRGAINQKARDENLELINLTIGDIFNKAYELGKAIGLDSKNLDKLKADLGITKNPQAKINFDG